MTSSVEDDKNLEIPIVFALHPNYPNPFNPSGAGQSPETTISFLIPKTSKVEISIYNIKGQKVKEVANNEFDKGIHSVVWNGDDEMGNPVSSGIYFYIMKTDNFLEIKKAILLK